ncbi:MAG: 3-methyl-2-oxobutanoate hydroxymethyltransferase [Elusimicrobia bacterium]|nr:3-methyl-2-oxobutanoate hydroxymethyltransferase [Elusimicrobiota bacterium]
MNDHLTPAQKITIADVQRKKLERQPITMLTAYDYPTALAVDQAGIDSILVGDSLGMVVLGYETTLPVTMEDMIHHAKAVSRGAKRALLIGDMPFLSYQASVAEAVKNAGRFLQEAGMDAVKLEGGREMLNAVKAIIAAGIPVMGHLGLTPQSVRKFGGFKSQGRTAQAALKILDDALALEAAGCFAVVLESIPDRVASFISQRLSIPTVGIGAGSGCDGQILVLHDMLGFFDRFTPKFVRRYGQLHQNIAGAIAAYKKDVETKMFPVHDHAYAINDAEWEYFLKEAEHSYAGRH